MREFGKTETENSAASPASVSNHRLGVILGCIGCVLSSGGAGPARGWFHRYGPACRARFIAPIVRHGLSAPRSRLARRRYYGR